MKPRDSAANTAPYFFALLIATGSFMFAACDKKSAKLDATGANETKKEKKIKYWVAPMDPTFVRDNPGKSPMGMDLVPVYEDEQGSAGSVTINPSVVQNIGVKTITAKKTDLAKTIRTVGVVTYDETRLTRIESKVAGWIEKLYVNETGAKVSVDTILLELYSPDLVTTQEEFILALKYRDAMKEGTDPTIVEGGQQLYESARRRLELFDTPLHQIAELEKTRKVKKTLHMHSTAEGVVIKKEVVEGMHVKPGIALYELADLSTVWVDVDIYEYEIPYVAVGQKAVMTLASRPGKEYVGQITYINPFLDRKSRTVKVRLEYSNKDGSLKPDMYANVVISGETSRDAVVIPVEAVIRTGARSVVFLDKGEGRFTPKDVVTGMESGGMVAILKGVMEGDRVVTSSQFLLDSESKLRETANKMLTGDEGEEVDHSKMDHSKMNHGDMKMDDSKVDHSGMDHSKMGH